MCYELACDATGPSAKKVPSGSRGPKRESNTSSVPKLLWHSSKATKNARFHTFLPNLICSEGLIFHFEVHAQQERQYNFGQLCAIWRKIRASEREEETSYLVQEKFE